MVLDSPYTVVVLANQDRPHQSLSASEPGAGSGEGEAETRRRGRSGNVTKVCDSAELSPINLLEDAAQSRAFSGIDHLDEADPSLPDASESQKQRYGSG